MFGAKFDLTNKDVLEVITDIRIDKEEYKIVVTGKQGPTGKTWICNRLLSLGYKVCELDLNELTDLPRYQEDKNYFLIDKDLKFIVVILNKEINNEVF